MTKFHNCNQISHCDQISQLRPNFNYKTIKDNGDNEDDADDADNANNTDKTDNVDNAHKTDNADNADNAKPFFAHSAVLQSLRCFVTHAAGEGIVCSSSCIAKVNFE